VAVARYKLDLVDVEEVRWDKRDIVRAVDYIFFSKKETKIISREYIFVHHRIVSAVQRVEFVSRRISYIVLRGH